jgi:hypothetical protein
VQNDENNILFIEKTRLRTLPIRSHDTKCGKFFQTYRNTMKRTSDGKTKKMYQLCNKNEQKSV